ncbi:MAG: hypothetical protein M0Z95_11960 [Actinomycetota bacterium]|jgi:hypothetical protein|nr:hypothetical protein [Actinomycetota bacterium]
MAGLKLGAVLGGDVGGTGGSPTSNAMYGHLGATKASPEAISGELIGLVIVELLLLGFVRFKFAKHFGG